MNERQSLCATAGVLDKNPRTDGRQQRVQMRPARLVFSIDAVGHTLLMRRLGGRCDER